MDNVKAVIETLENIKEYINKHGWMQDKLWERKNPNGPVCLLGALCKVTGSKPDADLESIQKYAKNAEKAARALVMCIEDNSSLRDDYIKNIKTFDLKIKRTTDNFKKSIFKEQKQYSSEDLFDLLNRLRDPAELNADIIEFNDNQKARRRFCVKLIKLLNM
jgi:hypothetical protein